MGLLSIIRKTRLKERQIRLLLLGLDNAGKTTLVRRIMGEDVTTVCPTLGFNIRTIMHRGFSINVWDIGGQRSLRPYWRNYFETTDAIIWVVDSADHSRFEDCKRELHSLLLEERLSGATLLVLANKQDLSNAASADEIARLLDLDSLKSHSTHVLPCSAREGAVFEKGDDRIWQGLDYIVSDVGHRVYYNVTKSFDDAAAAVPATTDHRTEATT